MDIQTTTNTDIQALAVTDGTGAARTHEAAASREAAVQTAAQAQPVPVAPLEQLKEILQAYGYKVTDKNMAMLTLMLDNALPLTPDNVARMNQALKLTDTPEKALFLLLNGIRLTPGNAAQLDGLSDGRIRVGEHIGSLLTAVSELSDPVLKESLLRLFANVENADTTLNAPAAPGTAATTGTLTGAAAGSMGTNAAANPPAEGTALTPPATLPTDGTATAPPITEPSAMKPLMTEAIVTEPQTEASAVTTPKFSEETTEPNVKTLQSKSPTEAAGTDQSPAAGKVVAEHASAETEQRLNPLMEKAAAETILQAEREARPARQIAPAPRLSYKLLDSRPEDIDRFVNSLREALTDARRMLDNRPETPETQRVLRQLQTLSEHIDFMTQIKNQLFVQLPVFHNGQETPAALHVYKDAKSNDKKGDQTHSALIALDTASMGHFETYVQKRAQAVSCQFRLRDEAVEKLVRGHIHELEALLQEYHYSLEAFSFLPLGEPYTVLNPPEQPDGQPAGSGSLHTFDRRV